MMTSTPDYKAWHLPLQDNAVTLRQAHASMKSVGAEQQSIPLMVQLIENPKFKIPGITLFHGAVHLEQHDYIHLVLGRGLLTKDEAFTIGFTMGATKQVNATEEKLFSWISKALYPSVYRFDKEDIEVFKNAVRLGFISGCEPLDEVDFNPLLDLPLKTVREKIGLETDLLAAYYRIEKKRYPDSIESQRLI